VSWLDSIEWNADGLVPVIAQEAGTGRVLMHAWMNREALEQTAASGEAVYWSRSRRRLWKKGEESGHVQKVSELRLDCDRDTLLIAVEQVGGIACHTGRESDFLEKLAAVVESRKGADPGTSYVARLLASGEDAILKKVGEEATETVMAGKDGDRRRIVAETADLWFHTIVMLAHYGLKPSDVLAELRRREGISGIDEKESRKKP
jgi:phosphoribosyl-ATP pyrophosphohydrolase/phosphoribosyl-AMP cyclohydrolase